MRSAFYVILGAIVMYVVFPYVFGWITRPIMEGLRSLPAHRNPDGSEFPAGTIVFTSFMAPFMLRVHLSMVAGIGLSLPFIVLEMWGFVSPGLHPHERRPFQLMAPFSVLLFAAGVGLGFSFMPAAVKWFLRFLVDFPNSVLLQDPQDYIEFVTKMLCVCGIVFQLPIVLVALGKFGIVRSTTLIKYWRHAVVAITTLAMIASPSPDPMSMVFLATPLVALYLVSIFLVKIVEPRQASSGATAR